ncbi:ABC-three component system middle component 6 [uncultured Sphingomonas sp.]|uniref:ABC-three component system middle component 6 n=1 Tax=uncultured Sphingomonas sp. TaxID=158754 RepID=UPI0025DA250E|nr:ABC-three component system middle component 6 [uncultured Sphingomonas sp.]
MNILPDKYTPEEFTLLGASAAIMERIDRPVPIASLWQNVRTDLRVRSFDRFADSLSLLYAIKVIDAQDGHVFRAQP